MGQATAKFEGEVSVGRIGCKGCRSRHKRYNAGHKGGQKLKATAGRGLFIALLLFVGIPLPGTGAWTGTLAASLLDMDFKESVLACMGGVLLAGCIMGVLSTLGISAFGALAG